MEISDKSCCTAPQFIEITAQDQNLKFITLSRLPSPHVALFVSKEDFSSQLSYSFPVPSAHQVLPSKSSMSQLLDFGTVLVSLKSRKIPRKISSQRILVVTMPEEAKN